MHSNDRERFSNLMTALALAFGRETPTQLFDIYWTGLEDHEISDVEQAAMIAIRTARFMPSVAELREAIALPAAVAWSTMLKAIHTHGAYASVTFADRAINATIESLGGWPRICGTDTDELHKWVRRDFERSYAAFAGRQEQPEYLVGLHERHNALRGIRTPVARIASAPSTPHATEPLQLPPGGPIE